MIRKFDSLMPAFLKAYDRHLLLNRPGLWATQFHYALFFGLGALLLAALAGLAYSVNLQSIPNPTLRFLVLWIPLLLALGFYGWRVSLFQVNKQFGQTSARAQGRDQLLYAGIISLVFAIPLLYSAQIGSRIGTSVPDEVLVQDLDRLNLGELYLEQLAAESEQGEFYAQYYDSYGGFDPGAASIFDLQEQLRQLSPAELGTILSAYQQTLRKYSPVPIRLEIESLTSHTADKANPLFSDQLAVARDQVLTPLNLIKQVKAERAFFQRKEFFQFYLFAAFAVWVLLMLFFKADGKHLMGALAIASVLGIMGYFISMVLGRILDISQDNLIIVLLLAGFGLTFWQGLIARESRRGLSWKRLNLIFSVGMLPFVPALSVVLWQKLFLPYSGLNSDTTFRLLLTGAAITLLLWNVLFLPHFGRIEANPRLN